MKVTVEVAQEEDGRWIAEVAELPGVMSYGATREQAVASAKALTLRVIADRLEHGETGPDLHDMPRSEGTRRAEHPS